MFAAEKIHVLFTFARIDRGLNLSSARNWAHCYVIEICTRHQNLFTFKLLLFFRHWLAADTKEERVAWIDGLNQALADVRAWEKDALKPLHNK